MLRSTIRMAGAPCWGSRQSRTAGAATCGGRTTDAFYARPGVSKTGGSTLLTASCPGRILPDQEDSMPPRVAPIAATLGAVVTDLELAHMDAPTWKTVEQAFHEHAVLVFPGQNLTEEEQVAFAKRFGDIELLAPNPEQRAVAISNQKPDGSV